jgi:hypothetical protein
MYVHEYIHLFIANRKGRYEHQNVIAFVFIGYIFACTTSVSSFPHTSVYIEYLILLLLNVELHRA